MDEDIEARVERYRTWSLTEELANDPNAFGWWLVANYGEPLLFDENPTRHKDACAYLKQLSQLTNWDYHGTLQQVRENYLLYLQARANRIGAEERESTLGRFVSRIIEAGRYTSKLQEALDDHLGVEPDNVTHSDAHTAKQVLEGLQQIDRTIAPYGYGIKAPEDYE